MKISRFEDLKVWQLSSKLSSEITELVKTFPRHEKYDLANQIRRSTRSIASDISEGFGRFHFNDKLTFYERARASLGESRNHLSEALANRYISQERNDYFYTKMQEIGYLLARMMTNVRKARDRYANEQKSKKVYSSAKH